MKFQAVLVFVVAMGICLLALTTSAHPEGARFRRQANNMNTTRSVECSNPAAFEYGCCEMCPSCPPEMFCYNPGSRGEGEEGCYTACPE